MQVEVPTRQQQETIAEVWSQRQWSKIDHSARYKALAARDENEQWAVLTRSARAVLKKYSTSFFIVTRFLPPGKRARVEAIYAAVRYPDEIVDTFPLAAQERLQLLDEWERMYAAALRAPTLRHSLESGVPSFIAAFAEVVRKAEIPAEYYHSFPTVGKTLFCGHGIRIVGIKGYITSEAAHTPAEERRRCFFRRRSAAI